MNKRRAGLTVDATEKALSEFAMGGKKPVKTRMATRGLIAKAKPRVVYQRLSRDEFGEMGARKRDAATTARANGHQMGPWRSRKGDAYGRQDAYCLDCNSVMTVCMEEPFDYKLPLTYGDVLLKTCPKIS
jgi:hypothetical protein